MRDLTTAMADGFSSANVTPALLAELYFDTGMIGVWSGVGTLTWGDKSYIGGGNLVGISEIRENQGLEATGLNCVLNGVDTSLIALAHTERQRGRSFRLYLAIVSTRPAVATEDGGDVLTEDGERVLVENELIDSPYRIFNGLMDTMEINTAGETATINLSVESLMIIGRKPKLRRYTSQEQKKYYLDDLGLDYIPNLQDKEVVW